ncbi:MAG: hypothetical protein FWC20_03295 [Oscillospiraceae bacterium]|nr:hypothetical protein [Oscillospiraceae bacterium]MCL2278417.1 hypothetical protein [Oscillospiraceae bacterium]
MRNKLFIGSPRNWLVVFIKNSSEDERALHENVEYLSALLSVKPLHYELMHFEPSVRQSLRNLGTEPSAEGELVEQLHELLINRIIKLSKQAKFHRFAVVLNRNDFGSEYVFQRAVKSPIFSDEKFHPICWRSNFLAMTKRLECLGVQCGTCSTSLECKHSCLPQLLWLLFNKDKRVGKMLKKD